MPASAGACLANSISAMERLWTSSGPSARRRVRMPAQLAASGESWLTPAPPCAWMASSMICSAMRGALTLIIAISALAALLPALSIRSAALRHSRREQSISIRASATRCSQTLCSARRLPKAVRALQPARHRAERFLGRADGAHAMVDAARPEPALRDLEPAALAEQQVRRRERARPSSAISMWPCGASS